MIAASHLSATLALLLFIISANSTHGTASASAAAAVGNNTSHNVDGQFTIVAAADDHVDCVDDEEAHINRLFSRHHSKTGKSKKTSKSSKSRRGKSAKKKCPPTDMTASPSNESAASTAPPTGAPPAETATPGPTSAFIKPTLAPSPSKVEASTLMPLTQTPSQSSSFTRFECLKIVADDGAEDDHFGYSIAVFGDTLVVGAKWDGDNGEDSGSAYIYQQDPETNEWIFQQKLVPNDGGEYGDEFGVSVAIYNSTVVVGAFKDDDKGYNSGSAYIYHQDSETKEWIFHQKLEAYDGAAEDYFGQSVDIFGDTLVVGARYDDDKGYNSGSAYIYHQDSETKEWIFQQKLVPDDGATYDEFGVSVAIYGNTLIVGAVGDDDKGGNSGSAYIYHQYPETKEWILQQKIVADDGAVDDYFGSSVDIFGDTLVVGARYDGDKGYNSGSVYIYHQDSETKEWVLQQKLVADDGSREDWFGDSVAIYNATVVVGAKYDDDKGRDSGSAYIYHQVTETKEWILQQKLVADDGSRGDHFGESVAIYNNTVVVGADYDDDKGTSSGSVYVCS